MPTTVRAQQRVRTSSRGQGRPGWWVVLIALELFVAVGAVYGGWTLMHGAWGLSTDMLDGTPFTRWGWPGVLLLVVVAAPMTFAALGEVRCASWAKGASLGAGALLMSWIVGQVAVIGLVFVLQPLMFVSGAAITGLAWWTHRDVTAAA
jgi:hypothetical protein